MKANAPWGIDEVGSIEEGKSADIILDVDKTKFTPGTSIPAQVVNNAVPADVETVTVDGDIVLRNGVPETMDSDDVRQRANQAVERFVDETGWELHVGGSEPLTSIETVRELPRRGPARLLTRLAIQSARDRFPF